MTQPPLTPIHRTALEGFSRESLSYSRGRPGYPDGLRAWLHDRLGLGPGRTVVDLGAGTGKFTGLLIDTGAKVIAIEPVDAMREQLLKHFPRVTAIGATAEAMGLDPGSIDTVVCAQSFHWFATQEALAEIRRVLVPGGKLGLVWNDRDESHPWVAAAIECIGRYEGDTPRFHTGRWRDAFNSEVFSALEESVFPYEHVGTPEQVIVEHLLSVSFIAALPAATKARVRDALEALVNTDEALRGRRTVSFPYRTHAYCCVRREPPE